MFFTNHIGQTEICGSSSCLPLPNQMYENSAFFTPDSGTVFVTQGVTECTPGVWESYFHITSVPGIASVTSVTDVCTEGADKVFYVRAGVKNFRYDGDSSMSFLTVSMLDENQNVLSTESNQIMFVDPNVQSWVFELTLPANTPTGRITIQVSVWTLTGIYDDLLIYDYSC